MQKKGEAGQLYWFVALLISIILILSGIVFYLLKKNTLLERQIPSLAIGQSIDYFDLINMKEEVIDSSSLISGNSSLIFIFSRPCSPCNANITFWNRMAQVSQGNVEVYGIVLDDLPHVSLLSRNKKVGFDLYVPANRERFVAKNRITSNRAQTILYHNGKIDSIIIGELDGDSYTRMMRTLKAL